MRFMNTLTPQNYSKHADLWITGVIIRISGLRTGKQKFELLTNLSRVYHAEVAGCP